MDILIGDLPILYSPGFAGTDRLGKKIEASHQVAAGLVGPFGENCPLPSRR